MRVRPLAAADYDEVIGRLDDWWGGRSMTDMLPRLFFDHFANTSLVAEDDSGRIAGFLVGFVSPTRPDQAYVHFVGVSPDDRRAGLARSLYLRFFDIVGGHGCESVHCVTSPVNRTSIAFHTSIGFVCEPADGDSDGVPVARDYDGPGQDRVRFSCRLA